MSRSIGVIDVGSNTVRLALYAVDGAAWRLLAARREVLRLAREGGHLDEAALRRTSTVLRRFRRVCQDYGAREIVAVATAAVRQADNGPDFVAALRAETGVHCRILDGRAEAELGFLGGLAGLDTRDGLMVDVGGASTEVTVFADRRMGSHESVPLGAVNATARWLASDPPSKAELRAMRRELAAAWSGLGWLEQARGLTVVGIGGTFRALAKVSQRRQGLHLPLHGTEVAPSLPAELVAQLAHLPAARRTGVPGVPAHRADIIVAGMAIITELVDRVGAERIVVSGQGLRDGLLLSGLGAGARGGGDLTGGAGQAVPDPFEESLRNCAAQFGVSTRRAGRVAALALQLFDGLQPLHNLGTAERRALRVAAELRDAGTAVDYYARDKHTCYLIRHAPLHGLSRRERDLAAAAGAFEKQTGHRELWVEMGGTAADEAVAARLGLLNAIADGLADVLPQPLPAPLAVTASPSLVRLGLPGGAAEACGPPLAPERSEDFRRLFGRPVTVTWQRDEPARGKGPGRGDAPAGAGARVDGEPRGRRRDRPAARSRR